VTKRLLPTGFLIAALTLLLTNLAQGQAVPVSADAKSQGIAPYVDYYEDASTSLGIDDMLDPAFAVNFLSYDDELLNFGITSSAYWFRFQLDWSTAPDSSRILEFGPPKIVSGIARGGIELFVVDASGTVTRQYSLGTRDDPRELPTLRRGFALQVDREFGELIYLRVTSARPLRLPITLWQRDAFQAEQVRADTMLGWQYGILFAMIFYNLFLFASIRENSYLNYVFMITAQAGFIFLDSKHLRYLLGQEFQTSWIVDMSERLIYPLMVITALLFQRSLLRIQDFNPRLDQVVRGAVAAFGVVTVLAFLPDEKIHQYLFIALLVFTIPLAFYSNIDAIRRGDATAAVHMVAIGDRKSVV